MRIMVDMSATLLHYGHIRLLKQAKKIGHVVVGLTRDEEILSKKGYKPEMAYEYRKELLEALSDVDEVVETPWLISEDVLDQYNIDLLLHGDDNCNEISPDRLKVVSRTQRISSMDLRHGALNSLVSIANKKKLLTPGPGRLLGANLEGLMPCFGRGDDSYDVVEDRVLGHLKEMTGHSHIARMQGSASLAIEVAITNFVYGKCLVIDSGYYSQRMVQMAQALAQTDLIGVVEVVSLQELDAVSGSYDWILSTYTETASALKNDVLAFSKLAKQVGARFLLDATGSIGLEDHHNVADVVCYSSCKGLLGLTGAAFVAFNEFPKNEVSSFSLSLHTYLEKKCTGPYHAISSLDHVLHNHDKVRQSIIEAKNNMMDRLKDRVVRPMVDQPVLCTLVEGKVISKENDVVLYQPRDVAAGTSVICHLGEADITGQPTNDIWDKIIIE